MIRKRKTRDEKADELVERGKLYEKLAAKCFTKAALIRAGVSIKAEKK